MHLCFVGCFYQEKLEIKVIPEYKHATLEFTGLHEKSSKEKKICIKDIVIIWIQIKYRYDIVAVCISCFCIKLICNLIF